MNDDATISERAVQANATHRQQMRHLEMGIGTTNLDFAIHQALTELGITGVEGDAGEEGSRTGRYSTLGKCLSEIVPTLRAHGVRVRQGVENAYSSEDGTGKTRMYNVFTDLKHVVSGEVERTLMPVPCAKPNDPQAAGAALTYGRRYSFLAALGLSGGESDQQAEAARPRDIGEQSADSSLLAELKAEMSAIKDHDKLTGWRAVAKNAARAERLNEAEFERLKQHWLACKEKLEEE